MSHDFQLDAQALRVLLSSAALHIGVLGPRRRTEKLLATLEQQAALPQSSCRTFGATFRAGCRPRSGWPWARRPRRRSRSRCGRGASGACRRDGRVPARPKRARAQRSGQSGPNASRPRRPRRRSSGQTELSRSSRPPSERARRRRAARRRMPCWPCWRRAARDELGHAQATGVLPRAAFAGRGDRGGLRGAGGPGGRRAGRARPRDSVHASRRWTSTCWSTGSGSWDWRRRSTCAAVWALARDARALLLVSGDQPHLAPAHLAALLAAHRASGRPVASVYSGVRGVPALFPRTAPRPCSSSRGCGRGGAAARLGPRR